MTQEQLGRLADVRLNEVESRLSHAPDTDFTAAREEELWSHGNW